MSSARDGRTTDASGGPRNFILGTAGHIDHGKTLLVKALTGADTDRLPEERRRGMTIELGFADLTIGDTRFGVVDVPGHERFVRTMVAGATGIDVALIVVAADDSVMPQTIEHVEILNLLGVRRAVVAITKIDTVGADMVELVAEDVRDLLADTPLKNAPICPVASTTGAGIEALSRAIVEAADDIARRPSRPPFRMAVDRVFTVKGRGTVVTGSVMRGAVATGDALEVWPGGHTCRVRDLQTHGEAGEMLACGQRAAINLSAIDRDRLRRGSELATPGYLQPSRILDVRVQCLPSCDGPVKSASVVRLGIGTTELPARMVLYEESRLEPGDLALAQLRMGEPITATHGQRFILRDSTSARTIGGGVVLRPDARSRRRDAAAGVGILRKLETVNDADRVEQVLRVAGFAAPTDLQVCARAGVELNDLPDIYKELQVQQRWIPIAGSDVNVVPAAIDDLKQRFLRWLERYHDGHPDEPGRHVDSAIGWLGRITNQSLARPLFDRMLADGAVRRLGSFVCLPRFAPALSASDERLLSGMLDEMLRAGFQPPSLESLSNAAQADRKRWQRLAKLAVALGELVQVDAKLYLHSQVERDLRTRVSDLIHDKGGVSVGEVREALGSSRKFVVPFLEYLDRVGFTKRVEDRRVLAGADGG